MTILDRRNSREHLAEPDEIAEAIAADRRASTRPGAAPARLEPAYFTTVKLFRAARDTFLAMSLASPVSR
jgi:hypothetical protein